MNPNGVILWETLISNVCREFILSSVVTAKRSTYSMILVCNSDKLIAQNA